MATTACVVVLIRHGRAEVGEGKADADRSLTAEGVRELEASCAGLAATGLVVDAVITSPLLRARETAALVAQGIGSGISPEVVEGLAPGAGPGAVLEALRGVRAGRCVAVVAHAPDLSGVVAGLVAPGGPRVVSFAPGTMACVEFEDTPALGTGHLLWARPPAELARLRSP